MEMIDVSFGLKDHCLLISAFKTQGFDKVWA